MYVSRQTQWHRDCWQMIELCEGREWVQSTPEIPRRLVAARFSLASQEHTPGAGCANPSIDVRIHFAAILRRGSVYLNRKATATPLLGRTVRVGNSGR